MQRPLASVIMPAYNASFFLDDAIDSLRQQTVDDWELIAVDDGSTDTTLEVLRSHARLDSRIIVFSMDGNSGPAKARNRAIEHARGRYIAFLDSDDLWEREKLEWQVDLFEKTGAPLVYGAYGRIDQYGRKRGRTVSVPERIDYGGLLNATVIATVTAMYDTERVGKVAMPDIRKRQDFALWLKILRTHGGEARAVTRPVAFLRKRPGSLSSNKVSALWYTWRVYREIEELAFFRSSYHFTHYAFRAFMKSL